ncbi:CD74 molecule, major histocompatibility complex, class II invariant chain b [Lates calcarifer]|uniref:CD74 molecule, major histocompatibility complex, class II invariant chain b n=1 Tax=Lates calcarifer TaxID=8187 RepID=A0A4W6F875_LATCA|nr:CD74 molecule, major histocompatibility complex, class II invariant chain b [Lates calcarifer]XP_018550784.1 CD74 molecule, major histocompatibility complex, class II invariant chain b [Lates calcarifer]
MSDPETPTQPLIGTTSQQTAVDVGAPAQGGRSTRAYKVAGLTLLACVLIMSQAMIAYFLLSQRNDIKSLEEQSNNLKTQLTKGTSVSVPVRMQMPMAALPEMMDDSVDEESSTKTTGKTVPQQATNCQLEAAGRKPVQVPGFFPACDERGFYQAQQCYMRKCWCVDPVNGNQIPGSLTDGSARCGAAVRHGGISTMLTLADADV